MSADQRVNAARDYLTAIRRHQVSELPPSVLVRECAELRRMLRQVLEVADDFEVTHLDQDTTQLMLFGGIYFASADADTVLRALADAAQCARDEHFPASPSDELGARYRELRDRIRRMT